MFTAFNPYARRASPRTTVVVAVSLLAAIFVACQPHGERTTTDSASGAVSVDAPRAAAGGADSMRPIAARVMTDENILAKAGASAREEVQLARLASNRVRNARVKRFAEELIEDHGRADRAVKDLERRLSLTEEPPANDSSAQHLEHLIDRFNSLPAKAFDTAFVNHAIDDHARDIAETRVLAGRAKRSEVRELLLSSIPELKAHLARAKELKVELRRHRRAR
jgi:putative membrane protein